MKSIPFFSLFVVTIALSGCWPYGEETVELSASRVATVTNNQYADANDGDDPMLRVQNWTTGGNWWVTRGLFDFDLTSIPSSDAITAAKLTLKHFVASGYDITPAVEPPSYTIEFYAIKDQWVESVVTWNNQPTLLPGAFYSWSPSGTPKATSELIDFDVTELIKSIKYNGFFGIGIRFKQEDVNQYRGLFFGSDDCPNAALVPKLTVVYEE